ncbi:MAG: hypothetical protein L3K09_06755, partial [Thermoplasmata archaeon]|nr:hypothetical protein [Thermoplasmata archaeon]
MRHLPAAYRIARAFRRASVFVVVVVLAFVATAAYSGAQIRLLKESSTQASVALVANNTLRVTAGFNISNPGFYPITGLVLSTQVYFPDGDPFAQGISASVTVGPGATSAVPLTALIALDSVASEPTLFTKDVQLPTTVRAQALYAGVFSVTLDAKTNLSWGAPFYGLSVQVGTPKGGGGGSVVVPVTVSFANHAMFAEVGSLRVTVDDAFGLTCGSQTFNMSVGPGGSYVDSQDVP